MKKPGARLLLFLIAAVISCVMIVAGSLVIQDHLPYREIQSFDGLQTHNCKTDGLTITTTGPDPYIILQEYSARLLTLRIDIEAIESDGVSAGALQLYINRGKGFLEEFSQTRRPVNGEQFLTTDCGIGILNSRLDVGSREGVTFRIRSVTCNPRSRKGILLAAAFAAVLFGIAFLLAKDASRHGTAWFLGSAVFFSWITAWLFLKYPSMRLFPVIMAAVFVCVMLLYILINRVEKAGQKGFLYLFIQLLFTLVSYAVFAWVLPANGGPDEAMRYQIVTFIRRHGTIPRGENPEIRDALWGISYAFNPILPYIAAGWLQRLLLHFTEDEHVLLFAARMLGVTASAGTVFISERIAKRLFSGGMRWVMPLLVALFPTFVYTSVYVSTEAFAIFASALLILFWIRGMESDWCVKDCIGLSAAMALILLSYKNSYGFVLVSIPFFFLTIRNKNGRKEYTAKRTLLVVALTFVMAGWWFIRNLVLYGFDPLASKAAKAIQELYVSDIVRGILRDTPRALGLTIREMLFDMKWLDTTFRSFFGGFASMTLYSPNFIIRAYEAVFEFAAAGLVIAAIASAVRMIRKKPDKNRIILNAAMLLAAVIPFVISLYYSYTSDFQAQGRYLLPGFVAISYLVCTGWEFPRSLMPASKEGGAPVLYQKSLPILLGALIIILFLMTLLETLYPYYFGGL